MINSALQYANFGWAVFPLIPNSKTPFKNSTGCKEATKDESKINQFPANCNLGVATGNISGFFVLDIVNKNGGVGDINLEILKDKYGTLPETVEQFTPSGGRHLLFKIPPETLISNSAS